MGADGKINAFSFATLMQQGDVFISFHLSFFFLRKWNLLNLLVSGILSAKTQRRTLLPGGSVTVAIWRASSFGQVSFVVGYFPDCFWFFCNCLTTSGAGMVGHLLTLQCNKDFDMKVFSHNKHVRCAQFGSKHVPKNVWITANNKVISVIFLLAD